MKYEYKVVYPPEGSAPFKAKTQLGWVSSSNLQQIDDICRFDPPTEQQFRGPRRIDPKKPPRRCQEWTSETIHLLKVKGVLKPISDNGHAGVTESSSASHAKGSSSKSSSSRTSSTYPRYQSSSSRGPVDGQVSRDGYWCWSSRVGHWYHVSKDGATVWASQHSSSSSRTSHR